LRFVDLAVVNQELAQVLLRVVRIRTDDHAVFEVDLLDNLRAVEFQHARLPTRCQKLEQVSDVHG